MDFKTLLVNRRAIREFQNRQVPLSVIDEIIQDTCLAPTASNGQPCKFVVIQNRKFMKRLSDESKKNFLSALAENPESPLKQYEATLRDETFNVFYNAPSLIYVTGPQKSPFLDVDCSLTVAYLMFSATTRGLGTCWIGLGAKIRDRQILLEMGITDDYRIVAPVIIGYPVSIPEPSERHAPDIVKIT
ncbi:MAG: Bifunctional F420 biosynthesis protein FbiB [Syntrophus sp. SKADARSKE-3]|nr:Bifunctional F420 biosynthesis protein FbiB [Syntrophus sp. SKADARSKE-3]